MWLRPNAHPDIHCPATEGRGCTVFIQPASRAVTAMHPRGPQRGDRARWASRPLSGCRAPYCRLSQTDIMWLKERAGKPLSSGRLSLCSVSPPWEGTGRTLEDRE